MILTDKLRLRTLILFIAFLYMVPTRSQVFNFKEYSVRDGIPQSTCNHLMQDSKGYLWFTTQKGAVKFDGKTFLSFNEKSGLNDNLIGEVYESADGAIWFAGSKGLIKMHNNRYTLIEFPESNPPGVYYSFFEDSGALFISCSNGLFRINGNQLVEHELNDSIGVVRETHTFKNGQVWAATPKGLYRFSNGELTQGVLTDYFIYDFDRDIAGNFWCASDVGIIMYTNKETRIYGKEQGLQYDRIENIVVDANQVVWFGSEGKGVGKFDGKSFFHFGKENGFTNTSVLDLMIDRENNLWIGGRNGLAKLGVYDPFVHYPKVMDIENSIVLGLYEDFDSTLWMATYGNGIIGIENDSFFSFASNLPEDRFFDMDQDSDGNYVLATASMGILVYNKQQKRVIKSIAPVDDLRVYSLFRDSRHNIWAATAIDGVIRYNPNEVLHIGRKEGLTSGKVMSIGEDNSGNIWIGTIGGGVCKFDGTRISAYTIENGLKANYIRSIEKDRNGTMWFGSATQGIFRINEADTSFFYFSEDDGLSSDNVYLIYNDSQNNLWVGTEKGIDRLILDDKSNILMVHNYSKDEGFINMETNINGYYEDSDHNIWFSTTTGLTKYIPDLDRKNKQEAGIYLTEMKLFFESCDWTPYCDSIYDGIPVNLDLPYNKNHITFEFIGLSLSNPGKVKYQYILEGQDEKWSPVTSENKAVYTNIAPGTYTFRVKAMNNSGVWTENPASVSLHIRLPWWREPFFLIGTLVLLITGVLLLIRIRLNSLKKAKNLLEDKVKERTAEINQQKEEILAQRDNIERKNQILEHQNVEIQQKNEQITSSIQYAERIQKAVLPDEVYISQHLSDYFILFMPKDIVSGDFYYVNKLGDKTIAAVVDCTGHGVPGGFMSMLGIAILNEIVNTNQPESLSAGKVLDSLRLQIINSLHQSQKLDDTRYSWSTEEVKDGMDISLIIFDDKTVNYSGAHNPLYVFRKDDHTMEEYKADKMPIGLYQKNMVRHFSDHYISVNSGVTLYLFSDGFSDQFGGPDGKKFKSQNFKKLLASIHKEPMLEQKNALNKSIRDWMKTDEIEYEQIDDITVLGVRIE